MADHLKNGDPRTMYTSPKIQNEIIDISGGLIQEEIVAGCNGAKYFGSIADEATDAATMEQMAICVRYYDTNTSKVREDFLGFSHAKATTGEVLADAYLDKLREYNVDITQMRGQGYDGAANMTGYYHGVQARVLRIIPEAIYTHCEAHNLNLSIVHASKEVLVRNMFDTVPEIAFSFNYSAKRLLIQDTLEAIDVPEMNRRTKLQSLCETRWAA